MRPGGSRSSTARRARRAVQRLHPKRWNPDKQGIEGSERHLGGDRDPGKRPIMGEIAQRLADVVIVTDDNPRTEDAADVRAQILAAAPKATEIGDRREAIEFAVSQMQPGDSLVVAGKGHEEGQIVGTETLPFSDHQVVAQALEATK